MAPRGWASTHCVARTLVVDRGGGGWDVMSPVCSAGPWSARRRFDVCVFQRACVFLVCHHTCGALLLCALLEDIKGLLYCDSTQLQPPAARTDTVHYIQGLISLPQTHSKIFKHDILPIQTIYCVLFLNALNVISK